MPKLPALKLSSRALARPTDSVVFAVYAPFGTDTKLATYPGDVRRAIQDQPLVNYLKQVAEEGVHVSALIDLVDDDSYLVEIPAGRCDKIAIGSVWKQAMSTPQALAGFLRRTHARFPRSAIVLSLEGHGAGYLPDIAAERITPASTSNGSGGLVDWIIQSGGSYPIQAGGNGSPLLGTSGSPELPTDPPEGLPSNLPMSNWGLAHALRLAGKAGVPRPAIIHFNNCFNMSMELLHSIRNLAGYATGYANYNFFTAGEAYPLVFRTLRQAGSATAEQLARWLAAGNHTVLFNKQNHPTVGATIELRRIDKVKLLLDSLANQLSSQIAAIPPASRRAHPDWIRIQNAVLAAQHYDTQAGYELKSPDQLTDLGSFAAQLQQQFQAPHPVNKAAGLLLGELLNVWQYGDRDRPHVDENQMWDFLDRRLGINILLPDPAVEGIWDWRSPYYFAGKVDPTQPPPLANQIEFLTDGPGKARPAWVKFLELYHDVRPLPEKKLTRLLPPSFPRFERNFKPKYPPTCTPRDKVGALLPERPTGHPGGPATHGYGKPPGAVQMPRRAKAPARKAKPAK